MLTSSPSDNVMLTSSPSDNVMLTSPPSDNVMLTSSPSDKYNVMLTSSPSDNVMLAPLNISMNNSCNVSSPINLAPTNSKIVNRNKASLRPRIRPSSPSSNQPPKVIKDIDNSNRLPSVSDDIPHIENVNLVDNSNLIDNLTNVINNVDTSIPDQTDDKDSTLYVNKDSINIVDKIDDCFKDCRDVDTFIDENIIIIDKNNIIDKNFRDEHSDECWSDARNYISDDCNNPSQQVLLSPQVKPVSSRTRSNKIQSTLVEDMSTPIIHAGQHSSTSSSTLPGTTNQPIGSPLDQHIPSEDQIQNNNLDEICELCLQTTTGVFQTVACEGTCERWFHTDCVGLSPKVLKSLRGKDWFCALL